MIDLNKYVGIPWVCNESSPDAADCWGLVSLVYKDLLSVNLETFKKEDIDTKEKTMDMIETIQSITLDWRKVVIPNKLDVVLMYDRQTKRPEHVGIYAGDGLILHSMYRENGQSAMHRAYLLERMFDKLEFYRYAS